jgi:hypothetical protein
MMRDEACLPARPPACAAHHTVCTGAAGHRHGPSAINMSRMACQAGATAGRARRAGRRPASQPSAEGGGRR